MARKRRILLTAEERHESEMYKRKLRSYKQELPSSSGTDDATAAIGERQKQQYDAGRKKRSDKQELPSTSSSRLGDTAANDEPLPSDTAAIGVPQQQEQSTVLARRIFQRPLPQLLEDEKQKYTIKSPYPQRFSIPENIIYYMTRNAISNRSHRNLLKTCKLIFRMSQIVPVEDVKDSDDIFVLSCSFSYKRVRMTYDAFKKLPVKLQIYGRIAVGNRNQSNPYLASALAQRIYKCSTEHMIIEYQNLTYGEIQILGGGNKLLKIVFIKNVVKNADGSITDFEKVLESLLCLNMWIELPTEHGIGKNTAKKMAEIFESKDDHWRLLLENVPQIFDGQSFARLLNPDTSSRICIKFTDTVSSAYKIQLRQFINQFYGNDNDPPISFHGLDDDDIQVL